jgi:hypothetical protein
MLKNLAANPKKKERIIDDTSTSTARATQEEVNRSMGKGELECGKRKKALRLVPVMRESTTGAHILDVAAGVKCLELLATGETKVAGQLGLPIVGLNVATKGAPPFSRGKRVVPGKRDVPHQIKSLIT